MNIKQAKNEIKHTVQAYLAKDGQGEYKIPAVRQRPVLLMGPPGIGKTQIMEQIARELGIGLVAYTITHHTRQSAVGLPFIREEAFEGRTYSVTEYTMSEIIASVYRRIRDSGQREGILFIDEINCVSETLAPTMLQFLQCKTFGNQAVPEGWLIVAAGNPPEYNKSVRDFDMVTLDRVRYLTVEADLKVWKEYARAQHIHGAILSYLELRPDNFYRVEADVDGVRFVTTVEADLKVWKEYARAQHIHGAILSYLELRPDNFYRVEADVDGVRFVTARGWEDLSALMGVYEELGLAVDETVVMEFLHHEQIAEDAAAYFDLYRKYEDDYGIPEILAGRVKPAVFARIFKAAFDERIAVTNLLCDGLRGLFQKTAEARDLVDGWYAFLKEYRSAVAEDAQPAELYVRLLAEREQAFLSAAENGSYTREKKSRGKQLLHLLKENSPQGDGAKECFMSAAAGRRGEGVLYERRRRF